MSVTDVATYRIEGWEPALHYCNRKSETDAGYMAGRDEKACLQQPGNHISCHSFFVPCERGRLPAFKLSSDESFAQQWKATLGKPSRSYLILNVNAHSPNEFRGLQDRTHVGDLIV